MQQTTEAIPMASRVHEQTRRFSRLVRAGSVIIALGFVAGGCQRTLFKSSDNRTQFDTTDQMRRRNVPLVEPDEFGNPQPALRARLGRRN